MGDGSVRDDFAPHADRFRRFLDFVGDNRIVVAGDLLELWKCHLGDCVRTYRDILDRLMHMGATLCVGNHDDELLGFAGMYPWSARIVERLQYNAGILILHGHQFDPINRATAITGQIATILAGKAETVWPAVDRSITKVGRWMHNRLTSVERIAAQGSTLIIAGHTHVAKTSENYINVGCWQGPVANYAVISEDSQTVQLLEFA
jgi:UDP-2,3-diacylglucosamine pyrophosphatase LpxH